MERYYCSIGLGISISTHKESLNEKITRNIA